MKNFISLMFLVFASVGILTAQDRNSDTIGLKNYVDSLSSKLNTLQHDYDYLYCKYELDRIIFDLKITYYDIVIHSNDILNKCYRGFDMNIYNSFIKDHSLTDANLKIVKDDILTTKKRIEDKIISSNLSYSEIELLKLKMQFLDSYTISVKKRLDYYKSLIDLYKSLK